MSDAAADPVRAASIRALFDNMRNTLPAVVFILLYVVGASAPFSDWRVIAAWVAAVLLFQLLRELLRRRFVAAAPPDGALERWANAFTIHQFFAGIVWGASMILFAHPDQPITVALTLCCLFSVAAGAVPAQAYNPRSFYALSFALFAIAFGRLLLTWQFPYILLGAASALFGVAMAGYCKLQSRTVVEGLRIRFENVALLEQLQIQTGEAQAARARAEAANVAKSQFLAAASHDLRQPLYALSLFSASLSELKLDARGKAVVAQIHDSIAAMEQLFNSLLDISRLEAGVVKPEFTAVSVDELFDQVSSTFWPIAFDAGLDLRFRSDGEWIRTDPALAGQVIGNLVSNAIRATTKGGVLVLARRRGRLVRIEVWDTGRGIAEADQARIFDEFVQVDNAERDRRKGLGLGLAIVKRSAALIGAQVALTSRPGRGTRVTFTQPMVDPPTGPVAQPAAPVGLAPTGAGTGRVLVIEDEIDVRAALVNLLQDWGIAADVVSNGPDALAHAATGERYRLILSDYRLPGGMDGLEVIAAVRAATDIPTPAMLVTGDMSADLLARANAAGIPLLHKPVKPSTLRALLGLDIDEART